MANHIPGYEPPPELEGFIPDIYAIRSADTFIVEIITVAGLDSEKHLALKNYARQFQGIRFICWMVDMAGRRMMHVR